MRYENEVGGAGRRWRRTAGIALVALGLLSFDAWGAFTGTAGEDLPVTAGTVTLSSSEPDASWDLAEAAGDIVPGDTIERLVDLTAGGSGAGSSVTLTVTEVDADADDLLFTDDADGLRLQVQRCGVAWTGASPPFTCGAPVDVWPADGDTDTPANDADGVVLANLLTDGSANRLRVRLHFPASAGNAFQGHDATMRFAFALDQRAAENDR